MDLKTRDGRRAQGELIKAAAASAGLTLKELATRLGVSHALIYQYVSGANLAQPDKLQEISQITGFPIGYFFGEVVEAPALPPESAAEPPIVDAGRLNQSLRQLEALAGAQEQASRDLPGLISTLEQMLSLARLAGDQSREADLLQRLGEARTDGGELRPAADALEASAALFRSLAREDRALSATQSLARARSLLGETSEAEALFRQVAASDNPDLSWRGLVGLGQLYETLDRYESALEEYERAREVIERLPSAADSLRRQADLYVRMNLGNVYMAEGDFATARVLWQENASLAEELSLADQFLEALLSESVCDLHTAQPGAAYELCQRSLRLARLLGDRERLSVAKACLSQILTLAGLSSEAREQGREAVRAARESGSSRATSLGNLALAHALILSGEGETARFALDSEVTSPRPRLRASALLLRSESWRREGRFTEAEEDASAALASVQDLGALYLEKAALVALASAAVRASDTGRLSGALDRAVELDRLTPGEPETAWMLAAARGAQSSLAGDSAGAAQGYRMAVDVIQSIRSDLSAHGVVEACLDDNEKLQVYRDAVEAARAAGQPELAETILAEANWPPLSELVGRIESEG